MFRAEAWEALCRDFEVVENHEERQLSAEEVLERIPGCEAAITGWGSPSFTLATLDADPQLKLIAHSAGTVKVLVGEVHQELQRRGITVVSGAAGIALNVAEVTIGSMILTSRRWLEQVEAFRAQKRGGGAFPRDAQTLLGATVGLVSASLVGREVIRLLQPFGCNILLYDPYITPQTARGLGVELVELEELFQRSDIVSIHAPAIPATDKMIGAAQLRRLRDGAAFINTSRGSVIDQDALLEECRTGRIVAAIDVTEPEPLPPDSPFWSLPNVILTPHIAGTGRAGYYRVGDIAVQALRDMALGRPIAAAVPLERWETLA